jgi:DNA repair ATPase RecN
MSEIINIEIQADQSGAEEALKQVNNSLKEGTEAAEALSHALDGDVAGAFKSLGELSKTLGIELGLAFSPAEIIAFVQIIAEVTDKVSKLIADTFIYTDEQKALDAQIKSSNQVIAGYAADIKKLNDEFEKMGKTASQKTAIDIAKLKTELEAANEAVYTLTGDLDQAKTKAADPNNINALGNANAIPGINNALGVAQQHQKVLLDQMRNLNGEEASGNCGKAKPSRSGGGDCGAEAGGSRS